MQFQQWGEDSFIEYLEKIFSSKNSILGIGDDSAVIPLKEGKTLLVTTDALVEGVHFIKEQITAQDLGYKTIAVNVSDIAAMGGKPLYCFLTIALPKNTDCLFVRNLMEGIKQACDHFGILLLGGDTVGSKRDLFLNLTLVGSGIPEQIKYRHQAQVGDVICVTGYLGDSGGGFKALQEKIHKTKDIDHLIRAHFHPEPSLEQGQWLGAHIEVHAMMDISDGLECDLKRLLKRSHKGAVIDISKVPISAPLARISKELGWDPLQLALTGGEDYCLLFTVSKTALDTMQEAFHNTFAHPLFPIGHITDNEGTLIYQKEGNTIPLHYANYNHFL